jgi:hypothetical protein
MYGEYCTVCCWYQSDWSERVGICENRTGAGCPVQGPCGDEDASEQERVPEPPAPLPQTTAAHGRTWWYAHEGD